MKSFVYGKYFRTGEGQDAGPNTLYIFKPDTETSFNAGMPTVIQFHGGAFIGGNAITESNPEVEAYLDSGIVYVSVAYRFVGETFYYEDSGGSPQEEEFVDVSDDGTLSLDSHRLLSEYKVVTGWQEVMTKCVYDAARALDYLLEHAVEIGLDSQRIGFNADSAGTAVSNYLTLVYPRLHGAPSYRVVSVTFRNAQLNYPFLPMLDAGWKLWRDDLGEDAPLSTICSKEGCPEVMGQGGKWCPRPSDCNSTWSEEAGKRFCGDSFATTTLGDLANWYTWPTSTAFERGLTKLWYTSSNFAELERSEAEGPLFVYVANVANSLDLDGMTHAAFWARAYARVLEKKAAKDVVFVAWYEDYPGMSESGRGTSRVGTLNYRSNFDWLANLGEKSEPDSEKERVLLHCRAMKLECAA